MSLPHRTIPIGGGMRTISSQRDVEGASMPVQAEMMNQPLCSILNYSELCLDCLAGDEKSGDKIKSYLDAIVAQVEYAAGLIGRMKQRAEKMENQDINGNRQDLIEDSIDRASHGDAGICR